MRKVLTLLFIVTAALVLFGIIAVNTASQGHPQGPDRFFKVQVIAAAVGSVLAFIISRIDYRIWRMKLFSILIAVASIALCCTVFAFEKVNGSHRWIELGPVSIQPSEFARIGLILVIAAWYAYVGPRVRRFRSGVLWPLLIIALFTLPVILAPDLGATVVMIISVGTILLDSGVKWKWILLGLSGLVIVGTLLIAGNENKRSRIRDYINSWKGVESTEKTAYNRNQAMECFARGGWKGVGFNESLQKERYLPEPNSDFIFAIIAEEFGIFATLGMVTAFLILLWCGLYVALHAPDRFGRFIALGLSFMVVFEAAFNIGMVTGCLPTKGIALPYTRAVGTNAIATLMAMGIIISVGR